MIKARANLNFINSVKQWASLNKKGRCRIKLGNYKNV